MRMELKHPGKLIYADLTYKINGMLFDVQNELGRYCNEKQYCDAIETRLKQEDIGYEREKILPVSFQGETPGRNKVDFLIEGVLVLEVKAKRIVNRVDYYQMQRYLKALNKKLGILVNFRDQAIKPKRILNSEGKL